MSVRGNYPVITHVVLDIREIIERAQRLINQVDFASPIEAKRLVEYILLLGDTESFDLDFWAYIETVLNEDQIEHLNECKIASVIDCIFGEIYTEITKSLGVKDPGLFSFSNWLGHDIVLAVNQNEQRSHRWNSPSLSQLV